MELIYLKNKLWNLLQESLVSKSFEDWFPLPFYAQQALLLVQ